MYFCKNFLLFINYKIFSNYEQNYEFFDCCTSYTILYGESNKQTIRTASDSIKQSAKATFS